MDEARNLVGKCSIISNIKFNQYGLGVSQIRHQEGLSQCIRVRVSPRTCSELSGKTSSRTKSLDDDIINA